MKNTIIIFLLSLSFFWGCQEKQTALTDAEKEAIISEVESQMAGIQSVIGQLDINAWSEYWSKDEFISVNSGVNYFDEYNVWQDSVAYWWSSLESRIFESNEIVVTPLASDLALCTRAIHINDLLKNGEQGKFYALVTVLWKKEIDGWKIINLHESWGTLNSEQEP